MKMHPSDYRELSRYLSAATRPAPTVQLRWDFFVAYTPYSFISHLYSYLNDNHIDTALRKLFAGFERKAIADAFGVSELLLDCGVSNRSDPIE